MEVAALWAFAEKMQKSVIWFAQVNNQMAQEEGDFEKRVANGRSEALEVIRLVSQNWQTQAEF